jgi:hypothetical protein
MANQLSPGVNVSEIDLTTVVPSVLTTGGAFAGNFAWGPVNKRTQVDSEITLGRVFYTPDNTNYQSWFSAASFLAYGNNLQVVRAANNQSFNADSNTAGANIQVQNNDVFQYTLLNQNNLNAYGPFMARYPGTLGNSLTVSIADSNTFTGMTTTGTVNTSISSTTVIGTGTLFAQELAVGSVLTTTGGVSLGTVASITSNTALTLTASASQTLTNASYKTNWAYATLFPSAPGTSLQAQSLGATNDELHVVVVDTGGLFTGVQNTVLETFPFLSKGSDSKDSLGNSNYYKNKIFNNSRYVYAVDPACYSTTSGTWGSPLSGTPYASLTYNFISNLVVPLSGGTIVTPTDADLSTSWALFSDKDQVDISLVITGPADVTVQQYVIDNIASSRGDCVAFVSPPSSAVINQSGSEVTNITTWFNSLARGTVASGSYVFADSGWKYIFDKYNNTYRWVPLNGDIAGLCAYTDKTRDPWWSPAGFNRGAIKNAVKLAWSPSQTSRDALYSLSVNPVVAFPAQGIVLYGDKTMQVKPSAFDRINVRRLFIILEKAISTASKYSLFDFNDNFSRNEFVSLVTPYLRDIQGRRGIFDFKVVCDTTNNTPQVIDSNQFVGDIYIKPARSINYIQLNFVAVRTGVSFTTITGSVSQ